MALCQQLHSCLQRFNVQGALQTNAPWRVVGCAFRILLPQLQELFLQHEGSACSVCTDCHEELASLSRGSKH